MITVLGYKRSIGGVFWVLGILLLFPILVLLYAQWNVMILIIGVLFGVVISLGVSFLLRNQMDIPSLRIVGGVAGFILGFLIVSGIALGFPLAKGVRYPSSKLLPEPVFQAVGQSWLVGTLSGVWNASNTVKLYFIPDKRK